MNRHLSPQLHHSLESPRATWSTEEQKFSELMDADAVLRPQLLARLHKLEPECAAKIAAMLIAFDLPDGESIPPF